MKHDEIKKSLPPALKRMISGYTWRQNHTGFSPARVFRLDAAEQPSLYLKISPPALAHSLRREKMRLEWLKNRLPVPEVLLFAADESHEYLLLSAISGTDASDEMLKDDFPRVVEQSVAGLKLIHGVPIENCPFDESGDCKIELAGRLVAAGLVDEDDFDEINRGKTAADLLRETIAAAPSGEDLVFTHGDYCLPNIILENKRVKGFVDWGNAGIADRFQDLALLTRSILYNFAAKPDKDAFDLEASVFEIYGVKPDWEKVRFYRLLDEFF
jgi:aminoglycoside phosphotransferase